jgi:hypothetical protein
MQEEEDPRRLRAPTDRRTAACYRESGARIDHLYPLRLAVELENRY